MENVLMSTYSLLWELQMDFKALRKEFGDKNIKPLRKSSFSQRILKPCIYLKEIIQIMQEKKRFVFKGISEEIQIKK